MAVNVRGSGKRLLTPEVIAMESLMRLQDHLIVIRTLRTDYKKYFERHIGNHVSIKKDFRTIVNDGRVITDSSVSPLVDRHVDIAVDTRKNVVLEFNDEDLTLDIQNFSQRYLSAGPEDIANVYDETAARKIMLGIPFSANPDSPGTGLTTDAMQDVRSLHTELAIPKNMSNYALLRPSDVASVSKDVKDVHLPPMVSQVIREAFQGKLAGFYVFDGVLTPDQVVLGSNQATPLVKANSGYEGDAIPTDGWGANNAKVINKGSQIQIAGVNHSRVRGERSDTGIPMTFTVTADVSTDGSGNATIPISPELNAGGLNTQDGSGNNVSLRAFKNASQKAANNAAITVIGSSKAANQNHTTSQRYKVGLFYEENIAQYVNVIIAKPTSSVWHGQAYDAQTGLSMTVVRDFDIKDMTETTRLDALWGIDMVYPELATKYLSSKVG